MLPTAVALERALRLYESGDHSEAKSLCGDVLKVAPDTQIALRLSALIAMQRSEPRAALRFLQRAIEIEPSSAEYHDLIGTAFRELGELDDALTSYRHAVVLDPNRAVSYNNLGACLFDQGQFDEAIACHERALVVDPNFAAAHYNLGNALQGKQQIEQAIPCYEMALRIDPNYGRAHANLGAAYFALNQLDAAHQHYSTALALLPTSPEVHNNFGAIKHRQGDITAALPLFQRAIDLQPDYADAIANLADSLIEQEKYTAAIECYESLCGLLSESAEAHNNLGVALHRARRIDEAIGCYERAITLQPRYAAGFSNRGAAYRDANELTTAEASFRQAISLAPGLIEAHVGLGDVLEDAQRCEEAMVCYDQAIALAPENAEARFARALALLRRGDFQYGWREYEWRWRTEQLQMRDLPGTRWQGEPLCGQTILVHAEQGLGDTIQFARYLPMVKAAGGMVVFACDERLRPLLEHADGIDEFTAIGSDLSRFNLHAPLLSLPHVFKTTIDTIPDTSPYLQSNDGLVDKWRNRLAGYRGMRIGICWQGNPQHRRDMLRSIPVESMVSLLEVESINLISLQFDSELGLSSGAVVGRTVDLSGSLDRTAGPFMDTAALMKNVDLVLSCDTSVAHLAGALGVPVWIALDYAADWRWMRGRDDSPWYPTMRLFRQASPGDWESVFAVIRNALCQELTTDC